jgi:hypothetical protein
MRLLITISAYSFFYALLNTLTIIECCISEIEQKCIKCIKSQYNIIIPTYTPGTKAKNIHLMHFAPLHIGASPKNMHYAMYFGGI